MKAGIDIENKVSYEPPDKFSSDEQFTSPKRETPNQYGHNKKRTDEQ
jgi:hypothetical protein